MRLFFRIAIVCVFPIVLLCNVGCNSDPGKPPPVIPPFEPEFTVRVNGGNDFTNSPFVDIEVCSGDVDSVLVWNGPLSGIDTGTWFAIAPPCLVIHAWGIGESEGEIPLNFVFRGIGGDSEAVRDTIVLDMTPPNVLPTGINPVDGGSGVSTGLGYSWSPAEDELDPGPLRYRIMTGNTNPPLAELRSGSKTQCLVPGLEKSSIYYWQVISIDGAGNEAIGPVWSFSTWDIDIPVFRLIPVGSFIMGSPESELGHSFNEDQHEVTLTRPFLVGETELTDGRMVALLQWAQDQGFVFVRGDTVFDSISIPEVPLVYVNLSSNYISWVDGAFSTDKPNNITTGLAWFGAAAVGEWLNIASGGQANIVRIGDWDYPSGSPYEYFGYRLPTEAEWEYACRAGSTTAFANGEITEGRCMDPVMDQIGWYCGNVVYYDWTPALKIPNQWGLYDMHGGYAEWCWDWNAPYPVGPVTDPVNPHPFSGRILRGGTNDPSLFATWCRSAQRWFQNPEATIWSPTGFRLVFGLGGTP